MNKVKVLTIFLAVFIVAECTACGSTEDGGYSKAGGDAKRTVRINESGVYVAAASIVMKEKGILEKYLPEGVGVEWSQIATAPDIRDAVLSGNADIADVSLMTFLTAQDQDIPLTAFSFSGSTPIYVYSHKADIDTLSDFSEADRISITNKGTNLHIAFLALCKQEMGNALALDANLVATPAADAVACLKSSEDYAGAVFSFPMSEQADEIEGLKMLFNLNDIVAEYSIGCVMVARTDYYKENADIVDAFLKAQEEAITFIVENPDDAAAVLSPYFNCGEEAIVDTICIMPPTNKITGYDKQAELLYEAGIISEEPEKFEELWNYDDIVK